MCVKQKSVVFAVVFLLSVTVAAAQDRALVVLSPAKVDANRCAAAAEPTILTLFDYKLGRQDEVRIGLTVTDASSGITRDEFNRLKKLRLRDLSELEVKDGLLYVSTGGQKMLAIPDVEPARNTTTRMSQFLEMAVEGESRDGRARQKQALPLRSVWRVFVLTPSLTEGEALFRHASQEKTVAQWTFFLGRVTSHKVKEAGDSLAAVTTECLDDAMARFETGAFQAIEEAKSHGQKLVAMSGGSGPAADRLASVQKAEQDARAKIAAGTQLMREQRWDDALTAWEPVAKYVTDPSQKEFGAAHSETLKRSHDLHFAAANDILQGVGAKGLTYEPGSDAPYRKALQEYEKALSRQPDSAVAKDGRRTMVITLALIDARRLRTAKDPSNARETLLKALKEHGEDVRIGVELREASCELSSQLLGQARTLATVAAAAKPGARGAAAYRVRSILTQKDKAAFTDARDKLSQSVELCSSDEKTKLLADVNVAFADYHIAEAKRSIARRHSATALLHLNAAQAYQPGRADLDALLDKVREPVQQRAQIQAGVVITSINNECTETAQQVAGAIESALIQGGAANIQLLGRDQAQTTLKQMRSATAGGATNQAIISGQIATCSLNVTSQRRQVPSKLQFRNERYEQLNRAEQEASQAYNRCRDAKGECSNQKAYLDQVRSQRSRENPIILRDYTYEEQPFTATGQLRMTLQIDDTILRGTRVAGEASGSLNETCLARRGVQSNDWGQNAASTATNDAAPARSGWRGFLSGVAKELTTPQQRQIPENVECPEAPRSTLLMTMGEQLSTQAQAHAATALRNVSRSYLELARRATDADVKLENYITFALLTSEKSGAEYTEALAAIRARGTDLNPESALR